MLEDGYYSALACPAFIELRKKCIEAYYHRNPSVFLTTEN